jgi:hypothetical protein
VEMIFGGRIIFSRTLFFLYRKVHNGTACAVGDAVAIFTCKAALEEERRTVAELLNCEPTEAGYDRNLAHSGVADVLDGLDRVSRFAFVGQGPRRITGRYMAR